MFRPSFAALPRRRFALLPLLLGLPAPRRAAAQAVPAIRIAVLGDSQAGGIAGALVRRLQGNRRFRVLDKSRISSGLAVLSTFDWPQAVRSIAATERPDVAVVMFGANDRPPVRLGNPADAARTLSFSATYGGRVRDVIHNLHAANVQVIWLGHPIVRDAQFATDMEFLNHLYQEGAAQEGAQFVPLWDLLAENGAYAAYGKGSDGQTRRLRADDGVHMTNAGYDLAVDRLLPRIEAALQAVHAGMPRFPGPGAVRSGGAARRASSWRSPRSPRWSGADGRARPRCRCRACGRRTRGQRRGWRRARSRMPGSSQITSPPSIAARTVRRLARVSAAASSFTPRLMTTVRARAGRSSSALWVPRVMPDRALALHRPRLGHADDAVAEHQAVARIIASVRPPPARAGARRVPAGPAVRPPAE